MIYVVIDICAITPMILSTKFEVIKAKLVMTWVKLGIAFISIILKIVATFYYNKNPDGKLAASKFLGFYVKNQIWRNVSIGIDVNDFRFL